MALTNGSGGGEAFAEEVFAGESAAVTKLRVQVARIAPHFRVALLTGERGTGTETVAREMHRLCPVGTEAFQAMDAGEFCAGDGEVPRVGGLFLRGLEELDGALQERMVRRLARLARETRVVVSSEWDVRGMMATGRMRPDLHAKVGTLEIRVPALRERAEDLDGIAAGMLGRMGSVGRFGEAALARMRACGWPGNLEELWDVCTRVARLEGEIGSADLPGMGSGPAEVAVRLEEVMQRHVLDVLQKCSGNKLKAAELLGISRSTLYRMLGAA